MSLVTLLYCPIMARLASPVMASWSARYRAGECFAVWNELRAYGPDGVPEAHREDAEEVARETMGRVAANVDVVVERLAAAHYAFAFPERARQVPTDDDLIAVRRAEQIIGPMPLALRSCLEIVGGVDLCGDGGAALPHVSYHADPYEDWVLYPDPLVLPSGVYLWHDWESWGGDVEQGCACTDHDEGELCRFHSEGFPFTFAPDEVHKASVSGSEQDIMLPSKSADPELFGSRRTGVTLVEYLRISLAWGGFPGYDAGPADAALPKMIEELRRDLLMF
ncbi:hypothetical protein [Microbispora bryophytorum]|uniref:hypothetical protein n=1 Tax=Microbispora bryophytorum TaxID=1460882 RepID=UPI0033E6E05C